MLSSDLDHIGLLCIGGQINKASIPTNTCHPVILPAKKLVYGAYFERPTPCSSSPVHKTATSSSQEAILNSQRTYGSPTCLKPAFYLSIEHVTRSDGRFPFSSITRWSVRFHSSSSKLLGLDGRYYIPKDYK
jgi:hypothetical protein